MKDVMAKCERLIGKINTRYDMSIEDVDQIYDASKDVFDMIIYGFRFGYLQGSKAAKAEMKRKEEKRA